MMRPLPAVTPEQSIHEVLPVRHLAHFGNDHRDFLALRTLRGRVHMRRHDRGCRDSRRGLDKLSSIHAVFFSGSRQKANSTKNAANGISPAITKPKSNECVRSM